MRTRTRTKVDRSWPSWRYSPSGEGRIFQTESEVPLGWTKKPGEVYVPEAEPIHHDRSDLIRQLNDKGIVAHPTWSAAYMREVLDK